jgi:hypothetical protein
MSTCRQNKALTEWQGDLPKLLISLVGAAGFEPAAPCSQSRCSTRLSYAPTRGIQRDSLSDACHSDSTAEAPLRSGLFLFRLDR